MNKHDLQTRLLGQSFGAWRVVSFYGKKGSKYAWNCICKCGTRREIISHDLTSGHTRSCGCMKASLTSRALKKHGHVTTRTKGKKSKTYVCWQNMKKRCYNPNSVGYENYGGRGIKVCDRWKDSFENFLADMGEAKDGLSIERIDNNGDYEPQNCRWATRKEQRRNTRACKPVNLGDPFGSKLLIDHCKDLNSDYEMVKNRVCIGWEPEHAIFVPPYKGRKMHERKRLTQYYKCLAAKSYSQPS